MLLRVLFVASFAALAGTSLASAQTLAQIGGPKEFPPASFTGMTFIDSRGCVFLRAGLDGQVNWVPRVTNDRKALCGYPPTFGPHPQVAVATEAEMAATEPQEAPVKPAAVAKPASVAKPAAPVAIAAAPVSRPPTATEAAVTARAAPGATRGCPATAPYGQMMQMADGRQTMTCSPNRSATVAVAAPSVASATPVQVSAVVPGASGALAPGRVTCPAQVPVLMRVPLRNGGSALFCTRGDGTLTGATAPRYPYGAPVGSSLSGSQYAYGSTAQPNGIAAPPSYAVATGPTVGVMPPLPKGYKRAWRDDRLNIYRGVGTAQGQAQQDMVWTQTVPARLVTDTPAHWYSAPVKTRPVSTGTVTTSSMSSPTEPTPRQTSIPASGKVYVQVGTFAQSANADTAAGRLAAQGLPVSRGKITSGGTPMQIVYAGPFGSGAEAQNALSAARRAGFGDAFIR